ncbi:MAG: hypothetical protein R3F61_22580 [Myxococcota bacterium]
MSAERPVLVGLLALLSGCGSLVGGDYRGEVLFEIEGQVYTDGFQSDGDVGVALVWSNGFDEDLGAQSVVVKTAFPARYTIQIYQPPAETTLIPFLGNEDLRAAVGDIVLYEDLDGDGRWSREVEPIVGGAFDAALIWVDGASPTFAEASSPVLDWEPDPGYSLIGREGIFSCYQDWQAFLRPLPDRRADLQVSYYFPGLYDWNCDGTWGWEDPNQGLPPDFVEECDPEIAADVCTQYLLEFADPTQADPQFLAEQVAFLQDDPFFRSCFEQGCPELLESLLPTQ